jgi:pilus assembly protein CpaB
LLLGLLLAGLTGLALYGVAAQSRDAGAARSSDSVDVVVASRDLPERTVLTADMLVTKKFPLDLVPTASATGPEPLLGQTTLVRIPAGAPVIATQLVSAAGTAGQSLTIDKGKVLVAFPTNDPLTVAGLVQRGDRVDILATVITVPVTEKAKTAQTIIQNLEVLNVIAPTKEQPNRATALTFVVDHQTALVLKYLRDAQATIDVVVRSRAETENTDTTRVNIVYLMDTYRLQP